MSGTTTYQVRYRVKGTLSWSTYSDPVTSTEQVLAGLKPDTRYELEVVATNDLGVVTSKIVEATTSQTLPSPPGAPIPSGITANSIVLNWGRSNTLGVTYQVWFRVHNVGSYAAYNGSTPGTSMTVTGLAPLTNYDFEVIATNSAGSATSASIQQATAATGTAPTAPTNLRTTAVSTANTVFLAWNGSTGTAPINYQPRYRVAGSGGAFQPFGGAIPGGSATITGLAGGTSYDFIVEAINAVATIASTVFTTSTAATTTAPSAPSGLAATNVAANSMTIGWVASTGTPAPAYQLQYRQGASGAFANFGAPIAGTSVNVTGLLAAVLYNFQVIATNTAGSTISTIFSQSTAAANVAPSAPAITLGTATQSTIPLSWANSTGSPTPTYQVGYRLAGTTTFTDVAATSPFTITGLIPGRSYDVHVTATNAAGSVVSSNAVGTTIAANSILGSFALGFSVLGASSVIGSPSGTVLNSTTGIITEDSGELWRLIDAATATESVQGTTLTTTTGTITDALLASWSLVTSGLGGLGVARNGTWDGITSQVTLLLYFNRQVYQQNNAGNWWFWNGTGWIATTDPRVVVNQESAQGTVVTSAATSIRDALGGTWTLGPAVAPLVGFAIVHNGTIDAITSQVVQLLYWNHLVYQNNDLGNWWSWNGTSWIAASDPRAPVTGGPGTGPAFAQPNVGALTLNNNWRASRDTNPVIFPGGFGRYAAFVKTYFYTFFSRPGEDGYFFNGVTAAFLDRAVFLNTPDVAQVFSVPDLPPSDGVIPINWITAGNIAGPMEWTYYAEPVAFTFTGAVFVDFNAGRGDIFTVTPNLRDGSGNLLGVCRPMPWGSYVDFTGIGAGWIAFLNYNMTADQVGNHLQ